MPEESTSPDLVELTRRGSEAESRGDLGAAMNLFTSDAVLVTERLGRFEGRDAIRGCFEMEYAQVWTLRSGKVVRVVEYDRAEAPKSVGLAE
jgi:ketosteroid isomerase-like protein